MQEQLLDRLGHRPKQGISKAQQLDRCDVPPMVATGQERSEDVDSCC
jgi:hypothetical protein